ncbi:MAG: branched-chain amino acid transport system substrate-binding protein [Solirubrobacteraceae bacterium]|jgi:branched-chain amino acid transport system substrate-binding protein|nr:branched-chain amino acid transport system substrate-binding protein [Solirubrobacteraceae bacterium]
MRTTRLRAGALAVAASALLFAACGSSDNSSSSGSSTTSTTDTTSTGSATTAPTGATIKLGMVCSCTGAQAAQLAPMSKVAQAWASSVNDAGGINGAKIDLKVADDGGNPTKSAQIVKEMVEKDKVVALVGQFSLADAAWADYVASKGIPVIGGISPEAPYLTNPDFFPSGSQLVTQTVGTFLLAAEKKATNVGVMYCAESPICAQLVPLAQGAAQLAGLKVTPLKVSSTAPNYTAQCLKFKNSGVDALFAAVASPVVIKITEGCAQQGFKPQTVSQTSTFSTAWLGSDALDGAVLSGFNANPYDNSLPAVKELNDALAKYQSLTPDDAEYNYDVIGPWAGGKLFEAAAKAGNLDASSTSDDIKKALYSLKNETLGGLTGPLNFVEGKPSFVPCYYSEQVSGGKLESLNGNKATCLTEQQAAGVAQALKALNG